MVKMRLPIIPESRYPSLSDDQVQGLPAACSGKDFRGRRDTAIIRQSLNTGRRLEGMVGLRYDTHDPDSSDVDLRSRRAHHRHGPT
jgi:site-specific recombinase XerC